MTDPVYPLHVQYIFDDNEYLFKRIKKQEVTMVRDQGYSLENLLVFSKFDDGDPQSEGRNVPRDESQFLEDISSEVFHSLLDNVSVSQLVLETTLDDNSSSSKKKKGKKKKESQSASEIFNEKIVRFSSLYYHPDNGTYLFVFYPTINIGTQERKRLTINQTNLEPFHKIELNFMNTNQSFTTMLVGPEFDSKGIRDTIQNISRVSSFRYTELLYNPMTNFQVADHDVIEPNENIFGSQTLSALGRFPVIMDHDRILMQKKISKISEHQNSNYPQILRVTRYNYPLNTYQEKTINYQKIQKPSSGTLTYEHENDIESINVEQDYEDWVMENYSSMIQD